MSLVCCAYSTLSFSAIWIFALSVNLAYFLYFCRGSASMQYDTFPIRAVMIYLRVKVRLFYPPSPIKRKVASSDTRRCFSSHAAWWTRPAIVRFMSCSQSGVKTAFLNLSSFQDGLKHSTIKSSIALRLDEFALIVPENRAISVRVPLEAALLPI